MTRIPLAYGQHPGGEAAEAGICVGCLAPPRKVRGLPQGCRRDDDETTDVSPSLQNDPRARGYGFARETLCAARRGEGARARETLRACRGHRSRTAGGLHEPWTILVVCSTCDRRVWLGGPRTSGTVLSNEVGACQPSRQKMTARGELPNCLDRLANPQSRKKFGRGLASRASKAGAPWSRPLACRLKRATLQQPHRGYIRVITKLGWKEWGWEGAPSTFFSRLLFLRSPPTILTQLMSNCLRIFQELTDACDLSDFPTI